MMLALMRESRIKWPEREGGLVKNSKKSAKIRTNILIKGLFRINPCWYTDFMSQRKYIGARDNRDTTSK
jgi:hypothetical protein